MNKKHSIALGLFLNLPIIALGCLMLWYYSNLTLGFKLGLFVMFLGLIGVYLIRIKVAVNLLLILNSLVFVYLIGEGVWYLKKPYDSYFGFNKAGAKYDSQIGYRWVTDNLRCFKFYNGQTTYDNVIHLNKQQKVASFDYSKPKADSLQRIMLFGDSFMEGIMLAENVPNRIYNLNAQKVNPNFELYSFAMDGGGIMNWHATFFNETTVNYDFDGIILAIYMDNLYRDYMVMDLHEDNSFIGRLDTLKKNIDKSRWNELRLQKRDLVYTDEEIESFKSNPGKTFDWPLKKEAYRFYKSLGANPHREKTRRIEDITALQKKMGRNKWNALKSIIDYCKTHNKTVQIASVPARYLLMNKEGKNNFHEAEMDLIAKHFDIPHFNGYDVFEKLNSEQINRHWLPFDGHWNQDGSNRFAQSLFIHLNQTSQN